MLDKSKIIDRKHLYFTLMFSIFLLFVHIGSNQLLRIIGKKAFIDIFATKPNLRPQIGHIAAIFIHIDRGHIIANTLITIVSFPIALRYTDIKSVISIFILGGIFGFVSFSIVGDLVNHPNATVGASGGLYSVMSNCLVLKVENIKSLEMLIYSIIPILFITVEVIRAFVLTNPLLLSDDEMVNLVHSVGVVSGYIFTVVLIYSRKNQDKL